ncbi:glycosyl transferase [Virgibacillus phasianinus]|uniref:Glycosyl transferase n=1 Tax=Virgibacillus phasianinus TaxID=2017483 RepID=A0A220TYM8_9BACI|nr:glycosyltransferase family 2 protein [Virgibacillus phasianinus]ASK61094.1 glycosyl transferase [Virgibacillus phasianinus]
MVSVSLCMIVKDEEDVLARCLDSAKDFLDEIIIVDTGSTDSTKSIARRYTDQVFDFKWVDHFAKARNFAFQHATKDYIFWLDADDVLTQEGQQEFVKLKETLDPSIDSVTMDYYLAFDEYGNVTSTLKRNRLVKRERNFQWIGAVHEYLEVGGNIFNSEIAVIHKSEHHDTDRNLNIYEKRLSHGEELSTRDLYYFANELMDHRMYERAIYYYEKFLKTRKGWVEDNIAACGKMADCYLELGRHELEFNSILRSFQYDRPRPEFCCRLGYHFLQKNELRTAIFWYELITDNQSRDTLGQVNLACSTWLPHLQLCVCYDRIGEYNLAYHHNELARQYRPDDQLILYNKKYLEPLIGRGDDEEK